MFYNLFKIYIPQSRVHEQTNDFIGHFVALGRFSRVAPISLVQDSNALKRVQGCPQIFTDLLR